MIESAFTLITDETVPYKNIALETLLLEKLPAHTAALYLWQNRRTVVIGRNQNAWQECRVADLEADGGFLARRLSGGGAVFHDLGNLNFTFILPIEDFDKDRQTSVILEAVRKAGVVARKSGRNDIEIDCGDDRNGRKFSGNAYFQSGNAALQHGTLLVHADLDAASRYLSAPQDKLAAKGVESVRSRVANLTEFAPNLTIPRLQELLIESFDAVYGVQSVPLREQDFLPASSPEAARLAELTEQFGGDEWKYGKNPPFTFEARKRFSWGSFEIRLDVQHNVIVEAAVFSDALDETFILDMIPTLCGAAFTKEAVSAALAARNAGDPDRLSRCADAVNMMF